MWRAGSRRLTWTATFLSTQTAGATAHRHVRVRLTLPESVEARTRADSNTRADSMDVEAEEHDEPASRRRNSLGLALDLRDLKRSLILSCAKTNRLSATSSYPYPSPVSPAAALFARPSSASSAASSSAASEVDSYFACHRSRQLSDATTVSELDGGKDTFDLAGDDVDRDLPPSPELIPLDLPPFSQLPEPELPLDCPLPLPVEPVPTHPMHRSHRFAMTPVPATTARCKAGLDLPAPSEMPHAAVLPQDEQSCPDACSPEPPRLRKSSIVDLPPVSAQASPMTGALELGLEPLPPTPPRSPGAKVRMAPLPDMERGWPAVARPWVSSEPLPQSSKVHLRSHYPFARVLVLTRCLLM